MLLDNLEVVLVKTRFPENIGMAARACVNMGCPVLRLVEPERWDREKARPLATPKGQGLLDAVTVHAALADAVAASSLVIGTTARTGGWRQALLSPHAAAREAAAALARGERVSLVFGPEDRGLDNEEITHCPRLATIPTDPAASSLNLAQAVLLMTYECAEAVRDRRRGAEAAAADDRAGGGAGEDGARPGGRKVTAAEQERLMAALRDMLLRLDCLHGDNPDYFFQPWRRLFGRAGLLRHEYDALMGLCRQVRRKLGA
ncbi:MAG: RNA methyltransferase [Desulfovibrio desulfuricans]|jgi:tRNA/rRNA methyltransferase|nr:RNA methyltransferase [Desulfovibrio desulfuricans]